MSRLPPSKSLNIRTPKVFLPDGIWRGPHAVVFAQGLRFALTGCVVLAVYMITTTVLAIVVGFPFQAALMIGFAVGLVVHFSLQRLFVWTDHDGFALAFPSQVGRYLLAATAQYGVTAASTLLIPAALGLPTEFVYLTTALLVTAVNFLLFRNYIFHGKRVGTGLGEAGTWPAWREPTDRL